MLEVCKKCIEFFILLKTIENHLKMYDFLQSRSRPGGVAKIEIRILAAVARIFLCFPQCVGITLFMNFGSPKRERSWFQCRPQIRFRVKFVFQDLPCESTNFFDDVILVLEWGRLFFIKIIKTHLEL